MARRKPFMVNVPHYRLKVVVFLGYGVEEFSGIAKRRYGISHPDPAESLGETLFCSHEADRTALIRCLRWTHGKPAEVGTLVHEILHTCLLINHVNGQRVDGENHEHLTYLVGWMTETILERARVAS
jgi:hypothetical protein